MEASLVDTPGKSQVVKHQNTGNGEDITQDILIKYVFLWLPQLPSGCGLLCLRSTLDMLTITAN